MALKACIRVWDEATGRNLDVPIVPQITSEQALQGSDSEAAESCSMHADARIGDSICTRTSVVD
jgi:hypothetical protein